MNINQAFNGGEGADFHEAGDFFRLMSATFACEVRYYRDGHEIARAEEVTEGYAERVEGGFHRVRIINGATAQTIKATWRQGNQVHFDRPPTGAVQVTNTNGAFTQAQATVTNASQQLLAANPLRRFLMVQNNDAAGVVYVTLDGTAATVAKGIKVAAGGSLDLDVFVPTGAINAIGSIASNANVVVVQG